MAMADDLTGTTMDDVDAAARTAFEASAGTPGAVVGVRTAQGTWTKAYGLADPEHGTAMSTSARFRIGSATKTFTGTVLLQLADERRLSLDDTIDRYVDGVPNGDRITLELLASMRSGVASYTNNVEFLGRVIADPTAAFTPTEVIEAGLAASPTFEPGSRFEYSNTNFILLGQVVEQVSGQPLGELFEQRIFGPIGLSNTSWPGVSCELPAPQAQGFTLAVPTASREHPANATNWNPSWGGAAGALISTVDDLLAYCHCLVTGNGGLLGPETQAMRLGSFRAAPDLGANVAYGLGLMRVGTWVGHSGDIPGYRTSMYHEPRADTTLVVLASSDIVAGRCPESLGAMTIRTDVECYAPNGRIFDAVANALGIPTVTPHPS
jgi:D-alanyl-D-alanine carboxypeptidase